VFASVSLMRTLSELRLVPKDVRICVTLATIISGVVYLGG